MNDLTEKTDEKTELSADPIHRIRLTLAANFDVIL